MALRPLRASESRRRGLPGFTPCPKGVSNPASGTFITLCLSASHHTALDNLPDRLKIPAIREQRPQMVAWSEYEPKSEFTLSANDFHQTELWRNPVSIRGCALWPGKKTPNSLSARSAVTFLTRASSKTWPSRKILLRKRPESLHGTGAPQPLY